MPEIKLEDDFMCFACGVKNEQGLRLKFELNNETLVTEFAFTKTYQGFKDVVHGGMLGLILDEVMVNLLWKLKKPAISAHIELRLKEPVRVGERIRFIGQIEREERRLIYTKARAEKAGGAIVAEARAKCIKI